MKDTLLFVGLMLLDAGLMLIISAMASGNINTIVLGVGFTLFDVGLLLFVRSLKNKNNEQ